MSAAAFDKRSSAVKALGRGVEDFDRRQVLSVVPAGDEHTSVIEQCGRVPHPALDERANFLDVVARGVEELERGNAASAS